MADIATAVRTVLANDAAVAAVVGTRLYPDRIPQKLVDTTTTYPCIRLQLVDERSDVHLTGMSRLAAATIQVDCYSLSRSTSTALGEKVRLALGMYSGTSASVIIQRCYPTASGFHSAEQSKDGTDLPKYRHTRDYDLFFQEATS